MMEKMIYADEVYAIQGAIFEVYRNLGAGFLESVYQEALEIELMLRGIPSKFQTDIKIQYKGRQLKQTYRADVVCYDKIILELKAVRNLLPEHEAQLQNYLRATNMHLGLLINFSHFPGVEIRRLAK